MPLRMFSLLSILTIIFVFHASAWNYDELSAFSHDLDSKKAVTLSNQTDNPESLTTAGWFYLTREWNLAQAEKSLSLAMSLDEYNALAAAGLGLINELKGVHDRAIFYYLSAALAQPDWLMGGAMLHRAAQLVPVNGGARNLITACQRLREDPGVSPQLSSFAGLLLVSLHWSEGNLQDSKAIASELGIIDKWLILGPINVQNSSASAFITPIETSAQIPAEYEVGGETFRWRQLPFGLSQTEVPLTEMLSPKDSVISYAITSIHVTKDVDAILLFGGPGLDRIWVDGIQILAEDEVRETRPDQTAISLHLLAGKHNLLIKTACQKAGGNLNFTLRFVDKAYQPMRLSCEASLDGFDSQKHTSLSKSLSFSIVNAPCNQGIDEANPLQWLWKGCLIERFQPFGANQDLAWRTMQKSHASYLSFLPARMMAGWASAITDRQNSAYDSVIAAEPNAMGAKLLKAKNLLDQNQTNPSQRLLAEIIAKQPSNPEAIYYYCYILYKDGLWDKVINLTDSIIKQRPSLFYIRYLHDLSSFKITPGNPVFGLNRDSLAQEPSYSAYRTMLADELLKQGQVNESRVLLEEGIRIDPYNKELHLALIDNLWGSGKTLEARQKTIQTMDLFPNEPKLYSMLGLMEQTAHNNDKAKAYYQKALNLSPQDAIVAERLAGLQPPEEDYYRPYRIRAEEIIQTPLSPELTNDAQAVFLLNQAVRRINDDGTSRVTRHIIVRIMTDEGAKLYNAQGILFSPELDRLKVISSRVISPDGTEWLTNTYRDQSVSDNTRKLFYNYVYRVYYFPHVSPGSVIDFEYALESGAEKLYGGVFSDYHRFAATEPTLRSEYILLSPKNRALNKKTYRGVPEPEVTINKANGDNTYKYSMINIAAMPQEDASPPLNDLSPLVRISGFSSWDDIGRWYWGLSRDRIAPTQEMQELVSQITKNGKYDALHLLDAYVASQIRYVGLELGISGYLPRRSQDVLDSRYGDCKDKTTLLINMLKLTGVKACFALLATRGSGFSVDPDFPTIGIFNHAITAIPTGNEEYHFTDPTAEFNGTDELPWVDSGVWALVIDEDSTRLVKTPSPSAEQNVDRVETELTISSNGSSTGKRNLIYGSFTGPMQRERFRKVEQRIKLLEEFWSFYWAGTEITDPIASDTEDLNTPMSISYSISIPRLSVPTGNLIRLPALLVLRKPGRRWSTALERKLPVMLDAPSTIIENTVYHLPDNASIEKMPENVLLDSPYAALSINYSQSGQTIIVQYELKNKTDRIEAVDFPEFRQVMQAMDKAENQRIIVRLAK